MFIAITIFSVWMRVPVCYAMVLMVKPHKEVPVQGEGSSLSLVSPFWISKIIIFLYLLYVSTDDGVLKCHTHTLGGD